MEAALNLRDLADFKSEMVGASHRDVETLLQDNAKLSISYLATRVLRAEKIISQLEAKTVQQERQIRQQDEISRRVSACENRLENAVIKFTELERKLPKENGNSVANGA